MYEYIGVLSFLCKSCLTFGVNDILGILSKYFKTKAMIANHCYKTYQLRNVCFIRFNKIVELFILINQMAKLKFLIIFNETICNYCLILNIHQFNINFD